MTGDDFTDHVGGEHPEIAAVPKAFIRRDFVYCPYCGEEL